MKRAVLGALAALGCFFSASQGAQAQTMTLPEALGPANAGALGPGGFGAPGTVSLSMDVTRQNLFFFNYNTDSKNSRLVLAPEIDYFIAPKLSLGGTVVFAYQKLTGGTISEFGLGPRVGYDIPMGDFLSFYLQATLLYLHTSSNPDVGASSSDNLLNLVLFAPLMFHPVPHFFVGLGPYLDLGLAGTKKTTNIGLAATIGGWFNW